MIRQVLRDDWERLRDVRLRALAHDPEAFLETHAEASQFPDERWQERATPADDSSSFVAERDDLFPADPETEVANRRCGFRYGAVLCLCHRLEYIIQDSRSRRVTALRARAAPPRRRGAGRPGGGR